MNTKALVFAVAAACFTSGAAFAQSYDYRDGGYERATQYQRGDQVSRYDRNGDGRVDGRYDRNGDGRVDRDYRDYRDNRDYSDNRGYRSDRQRYNSNDGYSRQRYYAPVQTYSYNSGYGNNSYGNNNYYQMRRGEYLSSQYRDQRYVVSDWRSRNLYQPQYGHQWVQSGNDYAMVAIATGLIAAVLLNH